MTVRFRRAGYRGQNSSGDQPRWHIAVHEYRKGEVYKKYVALCGFEIDMPWLRGGQLSYAKKPAGQHCMKCIAKAARGDG